MQNLWELRDGRLIRLLTKGEFRGIPKGRQLIAVSGRIVTKGKDFISKETQRGYMGYGVIHSK